MSKIKSVLKSVPGLRPMVRRTKQLAQRVTREPLDGFYTLSPDVLVALVRSLNLQHAEQQSGHDLFRGHGYYEFGMFRGFSFWFAEQVSRQYVGSDFRLLGFDSFEGLPEPQLASEAAAFGRGDFCGTYPAVTGNLKKWNADPARYRLYKGFYSDELFAKLRSTEHFPPISICLIDVDLYESCVPVLEFIRPMLVEGSILLFDDYNQLGEDDNAGERRALIEFEQRYPAFRKEHLFDYGWEGGAFRVVKTGL